MQIFQSFLQEIIAWMDWKNVILVIYIRYYQGAQQQQQHNK